MPSSADFSHSAKLFSPEGAAMGSGAGWRRRMPLGPSSAGSTSAPLMGADRWSTGKSSNEK